MQVIAGSGFSLVVTTGEPGSDDQTIAGVTCNCDAEEVAAGGESITSAPFSWPKNGAGAGHKCLAQVPIDTKARRGWTGRIPPDLAVTGLQEMGPVGLML